MKKFKAIFLFALLGFAASAQPESWFYIETTDSLAAPRFKTQNGLQHYTGNDTTLKAIFNNYQITDFKKTQRNTNKTNRHRKFFVRANSAALLHELLTKKPSLFAKGETIPPSDRKIFEPDDYGLTSTIGKNTGEPLFLDYLDFLGLPQAWYYTTGHRDVAIGISDGAVDSTDLDFKGKVTTLLKSPVANGHGYSTAANAAAQGDNGYGIPGVCYDCS
ncbi:MAG: hypothetical protein ACPGQR_09720, partial [Marinirhabdus sp.]